MTEIESGRPVRWSALLHGLRTGDLTDWAVAGSS